MTLPRLLVTGFDPFGDLAINTSQLVVEHLAKTAFDRFALDTQILPTAYGRSFEVLERKLDARPPDAVVMFGVADTIDRFSLETRAVNIRSTETLDNDGVAAPDPVIDPTGPEWLATTADASTLWSLLDAQGIDAHLSEDAGDYLCNFTYYALLRWIDAKRLRLPALFVHVPDMSGADARSRELQRLREDAATLLHHFARLMPEQDVDGSSDDHPSRR